MKEKQGPRAPESKFVICIATVMSRNVVDWMVLSSQWEVAEGTDRITIDRVKSVSHRESFFLCDSLRLYLGKLIKSCSRSQTFKPCT